MNKLLNLIDPEIGSAIEQEMQRQQNTLELIASENIASQAVLAAQGSILTNKYAEGLPGKRFYGGCEWVDVIERLAIKRAKILFKADHVNVQPHSGAQANIAVFFSVLEPHDTILGMKLAHGGHLTHGHPLSMTGKYFNVIQYGVEKETERIDYGMLESLADKHRPKMIIAGASSYPRIIDFARIREIADKIGAYMMVDMAHIAGLVAADLHPSPVPYADFVTTTTHKTLRGPRGGLILCRKELGRSIDRAVFPGIQGGPLMHVIAAKAVALKEAMSSEFREYQGQVVKNAATLGQALQRRGFRCVSGGTDTHFILLDLSEHGITGKEAEERLDSVNITINKNAIPFDKQSPLITSGVRIGTPAVTTRGMKEREMETIAELIAQQLHPSSDAAVAKKVKSQVLSLCDAFPLQG
ncbi:serine hydroxymethyltransferase [Candidatus Acetothermia bacterium]|nr:serine hydroxymethyltransferase [Candidatus Acetothermia bacterium]